MPVDSRRGSGFIPRRKLRSKPRKSKDATGSAVAVHQGPPASDRANLYATGGQPTPTSQADDDSSSSTAVPADAERTSSSTREAAASSPVGLPIDARQLERRQAEEKDFIRQHDSSEAQVWYLIDVQWLQAWKSFVTRGSQLPGPIDNSRLVDRQTGIPKRGLYAVSDYRGVNGEIWHFWLKRYGGGPTIRRKQLDLYSSDVAEDDSAAARQREPPLPGSAAAGEPSSRKGSGAEASVLHGRDRGDETDVSSTHAGTMVSSVDGSPGMPSPPAVQSSSSGSRRSGGSFFSSLGGGARASSSGRSSSQAHQVAVPTSQARRTEPAVKESSSLCCDKCDGPHETDKCPYFKKAREKHQDATVNYGKSRKILEDSGDGAPIVRNAVVIQQPGDGSCLFHSLSYGLQDRSTAASLRREICSYLAKNQDMTIADTAIADWIRYDSNETVSQYAQRMAGGNWGGGIEMAALTRMKNVNVHVYEKCREGYRRISAFESPSARKTVSVLYQGRMHYDAIVVD